MNAYDEILNRLIEAVLKHIDMHRDTPDGELRELIRTCVEREAAENELVSNCRGKLEDDIRHAICRFGILQPYLEDESVTEIMVNGIHPIYVERGGVLTETEDAFSSAEKLEDIIRRIVAGCNRMVNEASPIVDARMPGGERVCAIVGSVALGGPYLTVRKFSRQQYEVEDLVTMGSMPAGLGTFLSRAVSEKKSIVISGATGSGKTTLLSSLAAAVPKEERVICIEDSAELRLEGIGNLVRLETRSPNAEGRSAVTIRDLLRASLRMRPDRIIIGEVRGCEVLDMLQAMNTGHAGSLSTVHANSAPDALVRLETMALMDSEIPISVIRRQIASGIHYVVHMSRDVLGRRTVTQVLEIKGMEAGEIMCEEVYTYTGQ